MLNSDDLAFFATVVGSRSLAESARKLNVTAPAVTQRLRALETKTGVRLIDRSNRRLLLTDEGELVAQHSRVVAEAIESLTDALGDRRDAVSGHLRVAAPLGFGRTYVAPALLGFSDRHPGVRVSLDLQEHPGAHVPQSYDVIVYIGMLGLSNQIVTTLAPNRRILCASPEYLSEQPPITSPGDLIHQRCLVVRENDEDVTLWTFNHPDEGKRTIRIDPWMSSSDGTVVRDWTLAGKGIAIRSEWDVVDDLAAGRLVRVFDDWEPPAADVIAKIREQSRRSARTAAFLAFLRSALNPCPWRT